MNRWNDGRVTVFHAREQGAQRLEGLNAVDVREVLGSGLPAGPVSLFEDGRGRLWVGSNDAFGYFGRAYGFEVKGLQGISTASEAGTADVQQLADMIATRRIPAIFVETSIPRRTIEAVQAAVRSRGFDVQIGGSLYSDAMGDPGTDAGTYPGMVRHNVNTIVESLSAGTAAALAAGRERR